MVMHIGQELAACRMAEGVTQVETAQAMGKTQSQVSRIEHQDDMLVSTLILYCAAIGIDSWDFMEGLAL